MTLQNGLVHGSRAYLWADTAHWSLETGELHCHDSKLFMGLEWPWAGALSCSGGNPHEIVWAVGQAQPRDLPALLGEVAAALRAYCARGGTGRVLLATNIDSPRLFMVASDRPWPDREAFEPVELAHFTSSGNASAAYRQATVRGFTRRRMARVIDAQIGEEFEGAGALARLGRRCWIGGNVVELTVSRGGVDSRVLRAA